MVYGMVSHFSFLEDPDKHKHLRNGDIISPTATARYRFMINFNS